jgi:hypothetical protein
VLTIDDSFADHCLMFTPYNAADEATTLDAIYSNDQDAIAGTSSSRDFILNP